MGRLVWQAISTAQQHCYW